MSNGSPQLNLWLTYNVLNELIKSYDQKLRKDWEDGSVGKSAPHKPDEPTWKPDTVAEVADMSAGPVLLR